MKKKFFHKSVKNTIRLSFFVPFYSPGSTLIINKVVFFKKLIRWLSTTIYTVNVPIYIHTCV